MPRTSKISCFAIFLALLVATSLLYFILYADTSIRLVRIRPLENVSLATFYRKAKKDPRGSSLVEFDSEFRKKLETRLEEAAQDKKIIIFWAPAFGTKSPVRGPPRKQCGYCEITYNRSMVDDKRTGAVLYHFDGVKSWDMPTTRNPDHLHIFWTMESSATLKIANFNLETEEKYGMNATMTYRRDSDFLTNYGGGGGLGQLMGQNASIYENIMKGKTKLALTVVSNCHLTNGALIRVALLKQLKAAGLRIDTYGSCFSNWIDADVLRNSTHQYKFYFAYENAYHCKDYITEKFFDYALRRDIVPVVWGATKSDYEAVAPIGSYIYAEDFDSPEDLIRYLEFLDKNDNEYLKYFRWRTMKPGTMPLYHTVAGHCALCRALHGINFDGHIYHAYNRSSIPLFTDGIAKRIVPSLRKFIFGDESPECLSIAKK